MGHYHVHRLSANGIFKKKETQPPPPPPPKHRTWIWAWQKTVKRELNKENPSNTRISEKDLGIQKTFCKESFKSRLHENKSNVAWLTLFERQEVQELTVPKLTSVDYMYKDSVDLQTEIVKQSFQSIYDNLSVTEKDCAIIEKMTWEQNKNKQWYEGRSQRITATNLDESPRWKSLQNLRQFLRMLWNTEHLTTNTVLGDHMSLHPIEYMQIATKTSKFNSVDCLWTLNFLIWVLVPMLFLRTQRRTKIIRDKVSCSWQVEKCSSQHVCFRFRLFLQKRWKWWCEA